MQLGTDVNQIECYFTQPKSKDGQDNKSIVARSELNKMLLATQNIKSVELILRVKQKEPEENPLLKKELQK